MYNPARINGGGRAKRSRIPNPHSGRKHSQIVARLGPQAVQFSDLQDKKATNYGWKILSFKGEDFEVEYQYMCARNNSGVVKHKTKDKCIRVLSGQMFVIIDKEAIPLRAGQTFAIKAGNEYALATSGTGDAELVVCQGSNYDEDLVLIHPSDAVNPETNVPLIPPQAAVESRSKRESSKAQQHAETVAVKQKKRRGERVPVKSDKRRPPLEGQQVTGINPSPIGAGGYGG